MCRFQELAVNKCGYVIRCNECLHYQVLAGGIVLSLSGDEFERLNGK